MVVVAQEGSSQEEWDFQRKVGCHKSKKTYHSNSSAMMVEEP